MRGKRLFAMIMSVVLATSLMPSPAFANYTAAKDPVLHTNSQDNPESISVGTTVSGFANYDNPNWYVFSTSSKHSVYAIQITSKTDNATVGYNLYDTNGDSIGHRNTNTTRTDRFLLTSDSSYRLKLSASSGEGCSYTVTVTEIPSNPQYKSRGKDRNNPYQLKLGKATSSQFDDRSGSQEQWYTFTTETEKMPTFIRLINKSKRNSVSYDLYGTNGKRIDYFSTDTARTDAYALKENTRYVLKVSGDYHVNTGFTSFQVKVFHAKPGSISALKTKSRSSRRIEIEWGNAKNSNQYQIACRSASNADWTEHTTNNEYFSLNRLAKKTKYQFMVRGVCNVNNTLYYGPWSKTLTVKTKAS